MLTDNPYGIDYVYLETMLRYTIYTYSINLNSLQQQLIGITLNEQLHFFRDILLWVSIRIQWLHPSEEYYTVDGRSNIYHPCLSFSYHNTHDRRNDHKKWKGHYLLQSLHDKYYNAEQMPLVIKLLTIYTSSQWREIQTLSKNNILCRSVYP